MHEPACPSCPRSRRSAATSRRTSRGGRCARSRSSTSAGRARSRAPSWPPRSRAARRAARAPRQVPRLGARGRGVPAHAPADDRHAAARPAGAPPHTRVRFASTTARARASPTRAASAPASWRSARERSTRSSPRGWASSRSATSSPPRTCARWRGLARADQGVPARPEADRGRRQHLRRRGAVPRRIHPLRPADRLTRAQAGALRDAVVASLEAGIAAKGATIDDFRDPDGVSGSFQDQFLVHRREGEPCPRCGTPVRKLRAAGRGTYVCERCQPRPRARRARRRGGERDDRRQPGAVGARDELLIAAERLAVDDDLGERHHAGAARRARRGPAGSLARLISSYATPRLSSRAFAVAAEAARLGRVDGDPTHYFTKNSSCAGSSLKTEAIVLRSIRYGEADRILHLYTPDRGRVGAIAKGVRRARSRFGGRLEPFFRLDLVLYEGRSDLLTVTSAETRRRRIRGCARTRAALDVAARACDAVARLFDDGDPHRGVYHLLANELALLDARPGRARSRANALAFRLKLLLAAGFAPQLAGVRVMRRARAPRRASPAPPAAWCAPPARPARSRSTQEAHDFLVDGARPAAGRGARRARRGRSRQAERAILETLEHHAHVRLRARSAGGRIAAPMRAVGLRLRRGLARHARAARRQGRQRRRDDAGARRRARAGGLHDHHRGVRRLHEGRPGGARGAGRAGRRGARAPARSTPASGSATTRTRCSSPCARRARVDARDARHRPQPRPQRRRRSRASPSATEQRALRLGLLPPLRADVRQRRRAASRASASRTRSRQVKARARRQARHRARRRRAAELTERVQGALRLPAGPAGAAAPGDPRGVRLLDGRPRRRRTGASTASPTTGAPRSTSSRWCSATRATRRGSGVAFSRDEVTGAPEPSRRLPRQRPGRGRRLAACATRATSPSWPR